MAVSAQYFTNSGNRFTDNGRVRDTRNTHYDTRVTQPGRARQYAGTAQNHQYTKLSSTPALPSSGDWSVSGWFCVDSFPTSGTYGTLLSQFSQESGQGFTLQVDSNKKLRLYYSGTTTVSATGTTELKAGKWYFVAMNASVLSDYRIVSLKVDGLVDIGIAVLESAYSMTQTPTVLGAEGNPASTMGQFLQGKLWNWCIWAGKALSNSQIANLYLHPTTLLETGYLTRCYKLEESSVGVTSAYDCGSDIKHGTHTGNPAIYSDASVPASFANEVGYSIIGSVIPRREYTGNTGYDALNGTALQFVGRATRHAKVNGVNALKFNGDGGYVDIGAVTGARTGSAKRTICCWVKPLAFGNDEALPILQYSSTSGNGKKMIIYAENSSTFSKKSFSVGCGGHRVVANDSDLSVGTWYHVAVTFPANTSMSSGIEIFINGKNANASTEDGSPVALSTGTVDIKLAADMLGATTGNCVLSDVRIYNEDLGSDMDSYGDSANIAKVMYGELHLVSNLKGAWPLAEGSGDELYEIVGGAHGATDTTATSGAGTEYPVWDIGDGIPSYNLRYGHSKALLMEDSDEYVSSRRIYDLDKYTSWTFECEFKIPGSSLTTGVKLLALEGDTGYTHISVTYEGKTSIFLGGSTHGTNAWINANTGFGANQWHKLKVSYDADAGELTIWKDGNTTAFGTQSVSSPASKTGRLLLGVGVTPVTWLLREAQWTYGGKVGHIYKCSDGYGEVLPDSKGGGIPDGGGVVDGKWHYVPAKSDGTAYAADGSPLTNGVGAYHNNAEASLDFSGDEPKAPWLYDRVVPGAANGSGGTYPCYRFGDQVGMVEKISANVIQLQDPQATGADASRMIKGTSEADIEAAIDQALEVMGVAGELNLVLDERTWPITAQIEFTTAVSIYGLNAELKTYYAAPDTNHAAFKWTRTTGLAYNSSLYLAMDEDVVVDPGSSYGSEVKCAALASSVSVGDWVDLKSDVEIQGLRPHYYPTTNAAQRPTELHKVAYVDTSNGIIGLEDQVIDVVETSDNARIAKVAMKNDIVVRGLTVTTDSNASGVVFNFEECSDLLVENIWFNAGAKGGIDLHHVGDFTIRDLTIVSFRDPIPGDYGIVFAGVARGVVERYTAAHLWHPYTTSSTYDVNPIRYGTPRDVEVRSAVFEQDYGTVPPGGQGTTNSACADAHAEGYDIRLVDSEIRIVSESQVKGVQCRCRNMLIKGTTVRGYAGETGESQFGVYALAENCVVEESIFIDNIYGVVLDQQLAYSAPYDDFSGCKSKNNVYRQNKYAGLKMHNNESDGDVFIENGGGYSIHSGMAVFNDSAGTVTNGVFYHDGTAQTKSIRSWWGNPITNNTMTIGGTGLGNQFVGYGNLGLDAIVAPSGVSYGPPNYNGNTIS